MNLSGFLHTVNGFLAGNLLYVLLGVLVLNMVQRRHQRQTQNKRFATLYIAVLVLTLMAGTIAIVYFRLPDLLLLPLVLALALVGYLNRRHVFPFRLRCSRCAARLGWNRILFFDDNACEACAAAPTQTSDDDGTRVSRDTDAPDAD
jgi:hypothetical protein